MNAPAFHEISKSDRDLFNLLFRIPAIRQSDVHAGSQDTTEEMQAIATHRLAGFDAATYLAQVTQSEGGAWIDGKLRAPIDEAGRMRHWYRVDYSYSGADDAWFSGHLSSPELFAIMAQTAANFEIFDVRIKYTGSLRPSEKGQG